MNELEGLSLVVASFSIFICTFLMQDQDVVNVHVRQVLSVVLILINLLTTGYFVLRIFVEVYRWSVKVLDQDGSGEVRGLLSTHAPCCLPGYAAWGHRLGFAVVDALHMGYMVGYGGSVV